jgi:hypothetical protein
MSASPAVHEDLSRAPKVQPSSDRGFGLVFVAFFGLLALWPLVHSRPWHPWALGAALAILIVAVNRPSLLHPANVVWTGLSGVLAKIMNPLVLGIMFVVVFIPARIFLLISGKDPLGRRWERKSASYWIKRDPPGPAPDSIRHPY